ncbi:MAG TPA: hypothetical protein VNW95_13390 [Mucilaginibacter sp.]|jgi:hypothetical protein|nr:hypothetical protein [Mucilaginibacter sp.]
MVNKEIKFFVILILGVGILFESYLLIRQCNLSRTVDITRQASCKGDNIKLPVSACYEDVSLQIKVTSPGEFLFITNKMSNPVLTLFNIIIGILAVNLVLKLKGFEFQIRELMVLRLILALTAFKLAILSFMGLYMQNWFRGNLLLNNSGYSLKDGYSNTDIYLLGMFFIWILTGYLNRQIRVKSQQSPVQEYA